MTTLSMFSFIHFVSFFVVNFRHSFRSFIFFRLIIFDLILLFRVNFFHKYLLLLIDSDFNLLILWL